MKKIISLLLSVFILFSLAMTGFAADESVAETEIILQVGSPTMTVNDEDMPIDEQGTVPVIVDNRTLLPIRAIIEQMGGTVSWNGETQTVTLNYCESEIMLVIDNTTAYLNGEAQVLDVAPTVINDRTMLPIRFVAESLKFNVDWNDAEQKVTITKTAVFGQTTTKSDPKQTDDTSAFDNSEVEENKALIVYFSATGTTKALAETIAEATGADIVEIVPENPYTSADLSYNNDNCRANREQNDNSARPAIANKIDNIDDYDTIFLGYPIWWGTMPKIINTFLETYDFSDKTIMPFCTSGGSGIETSVSAIKSTCQGADVKDGLRGSSSTSSTQVKEWIDKNTKE